MILIHVLTLALLTSCSPLLIQEAIEVEHILESEIERERTH